MSPTNLNYLLSLPRVGGLTSLDTQGTLSWASGRLRNFLPLLSALKILKITKDKATYERGWPTTTPMTIKDNHQQEDKSLKTSDRWVCASIECKLI